MMLWIISLSLQVVGVVLNLAIVVTVWRKGLMRIPSTRFVFSLCMSHLVVSLISLIISILPLIITMDEGYLWVGQAVGFYTTVTVAISSLFTLTVISVERYVTIARPMECKRIVTPRRCLIAIFCTYALTLLLVLPPALFFPTRGEGVGIYWYFGSIFSLLTLAALTTMTLCYSHIYTIAREKCRKVRLGEFRTAPASISSDWPSSVHPSAHPLPRGTSSHSLFQFTRNLGPQRQETPKRQLKGKRDSPAISVRSAPTSPILTTDHGLLRAKRRWKAYLQHNYNSPKKTIFTILTLIGSVVVTSLPPAFALIIIPSLFAPIHAILFPLSSVLHPLLYGILNRNIRHHLRPPRASASLPKSLRRKKVKRKVSTLGDLFTFSKPRRMFVPNNQQQGKRKASLTSDEDLCLRPKRKDTTAIFHAESVRELLRDRVGEAGIPNLRVEPIIVDVQLVPHEEDEEEVEQEEQDEVLEEELILQAMEMPRKPSQDSGADMNFSDGEEEDLIEPPSPFHLSQSSLRHIHMFLSQQQVSKSDSDINCPRRGFHTRSHSNLPLNPGKMLGTGLNHPPQSLSLSADAYLNQPTSMNRRSVIGGGVVSRSVGEELLLIHRDSKDCQQLALPVPFFFRSVQHRLHNEFSEDSETEDDSGDDNDQELLGVSIPS